MPRTHSLLLACGILLAPSMVSATAHRNPPPLVNVGGASKPLRLVGLVPSSYADVAQIEDFLHAVPSEDKPKFDRLNQVLQENLSGIKVYKVGDEAEKEVYVVGKTPDGKWAGFKTTVVET